MPALDHQRLPFTEQIAFFRAKLGNLVPTQVWTDVWKAQHDRAFMVAGAMKADLLADLAGAVEAAISEGIGIGEFRKRFDSIVDRHGWAYRGERNWRTRVIYQTNISTSYAAGRLAQLRDPGLRKLKPFWMYKHSDSVLHPRPLHVSWDGLTLPADDPWFKTHYPPNGWGCKCRVVAVSEGEAKRNGGRFGPAPDDGFNPATGEPEGIDKGWGYMPGDSVTGDLKSQIKAKRKRLPKKIAEDLEQAVLTPADPFALPEFTPAKTVKEAERLAQKIIGTPGPVKYQADADGNAMVRFSHHVSRGRFGAFKYKDGIRETIYGKAKYTGLTLETANEVNRTLIELQRECDRLGIPRLRGVKTGAGRALASMGDGVMSLSKHLKLLSVDRPSPSTAVRSSPLGEKPFTTEAYFTQPIDVLNSTLWHEFAHHIHHQFKVSSAGEYLSPPLERALVEFTKARHGSLQIPSRYGATNSKEFWAESYNLYKLGREDLIDPDLLPFIEKVEKGVLP